MTPHDEVLTALEALAAETGIPDGHGEKVRVDRRSQLRHLGIRTPDRRRRVSQGFSFTADEPEAVLAQWNEIWMATECADVAFAVLDHYRSHVERVALPGFWPTASGWIERVDDQRPDVAKAVGWVLRETSVVDPDEVAAFCEAHASVMSAATMKRATQKLEAGRRDELVAAAATRRREG